MIYERLETVLSTPEPIWNIPLPPYFCLSKGTGSPLVCPVTREFPLIRVSIRHSPDDGVIVNPYTVQG